MIHIGLFEGIGGFSLAAQWAGWETLATCEINPFGQRVLKYYWPDAYHHGDIKTLTYDTINAELSTRFGDGWRNRPVIITGGFPCQPYSLAGKRLGKEDDRHLWPQMLRVIREVQPEWVVGENVFGLINWAGGLVFNEVQADLEAAGYEVQPYVLPACGVNAPHRRDRVWFVANRTGMGRYERRSDSNGENQAATIRANIFSDIERLSEIFITPNSSDAGSQSLQQGGENRIHEINSSANSDNHGSHGSEDGQGNHQGDDRNQTRANSVEQLEGCSGQATRITTNPNSTPTRNEVQARRDMPASNVFTDSSSSRREKCNVTKKSDSPRYSSRLPIEDWSIWPTQSPVCSYDDGLPLQLVGITFSKHRNESIKAFGNAIVPQVVYQIFKAINEYNHESNNQLPPMHPLK